MSKHFNKGHGRSKAPCSDRWAHPHGRWATPGGFSYSQEGKEVSAPCPGPFSWTSAVASAASAFPCGPKGTSPQICCDCSACNGKAGLSTLYQKRDKAASCHWLPLARPESLVCPTSSRGSRGHRFLSPRNAPSLQSEH